MCANDSLSAPDLMHIKSPVSFVAYVREHSWQGLHMEVFISSLPAGSQTPPPLFYRSSTFVLTAADRHHFLPPS